MAGYIRPKHTSLTLFINLFQEHCLHPSHSMVLGIIWLGVKLNTTRFCKGIEELKFLFDSMTLTFQWTKCINIYSQWLTNHMHDRGYLLGSLYAYQSNKRRQVIEETKFTSTVPTPWSKARMVILIGDHLKNRAFPCFILELSHLYTQELIKL